MTHPLPVKKTDQIQIEIVDEDGKTSIQKPVNIDEILKQEDHTLDIGHNIRLRVEEFNPDEDYEDDNIEESEDSSDSSTFDGDHLSTDPPPGTQAGGWYEVLNALRKEHDETVREEKRKNIQGGMLIKHLSTATPLKKFTRQEEVENKSLDTQMVEEGLKLAASASEKSRHEVWSSLSPPPPVPERDYQHLQYVSAHPISIRHFRPPALTFHAMTSYISAKDKCRRILVYGGVGIAGKAVEQELYEYSLLTLNWRRVEGKQFVPAGHTGTP
ncbi:hypothetical protein AGDE_12672 [Angomonas deanei]|nr:hypothetical protein AGDE_12672 [Angomonas deanei]|eukprot:EPY23874.1 hypothetical protein AGDE_12672 [Angomonas deanei]